MSTARPLGLPSKLGEGRSINANAATGWSGDRRLRVLEPLGAAQDDKRNARDRERAADPFEPADPLAQNGHRARYGEQRRQQYEDHDAVHRVTTQKMEPYTVADDRGRHDHIDDRQVRPDARGHKARDLVLLESEGQGEHRRRGEARDQGGERERRDVLESLDEDVAVGPGESRAQ